MEDTIQSSPEIAPQGEALEIQIEESSSVLRKVNIGIPESRIKSKYDTVLKTLVKDAALPGFRKGRVPRRLLEKRFKADISNDVRSQVVSEALSEAIENNNLQPLSEPKFEPAQPEVPETGPMKFSVAFEVLPEFALPDLSTFELKKPALAVTEERINLAKEHLRGNLAELQDVPEISDPEDHIDTDAQILDQSGTLIEAFPHRHVHLTPEYSIGDIQITGFDGHLRGAKAGSTLRIDVTLPDTHKREDLRGQKATVELKITKIQRRVKPELTEELAKANGFDGLKDLNDSLQRAIEERLKSEGARLLREQAAEKLREVIQIEVPSSLVTRATGQLAQSVMQQAAQAGQQPELTAEMVERMRAASEPRAKLDAIVMRLADKFGLEVQNEEINAEVAAIADMNGMRPELLLSRMNKAGQLESVRADLLQRKVLDRIAEQCKIIEIDEAQWKREQDELRASMAAQQAAVLPQQPSSGEPAASGA
ncbi:MAG: trigger factor [Phycisphaerae bacterium]